MQKYATLAISIVFIPSIAFASWWNPFTWFSYQVPVQSSIASSHTIKPVTPTDNNPPAVAPIKKSPVEKKKPVEKPIVKITPTVTPTTETAINTVPPETTLCNGIYWKKCPAGQDFICPASGDARCQVPTPQNPSPINNDDGYQQKLLNDQAARQAQAQQEAQYQQQNSAIQAKQTQRNTLTNDYNAQVAALNQQIIDIKNQYYVDIANIDARPGDAYSANGEKQNALTKANTKIEQINLQIQQLTLDYNNRINQL